MKGPRFGCPNCSSPDPSDDELCPECLQAKIDYLKRLEPPATKDRDEDTAAEPESAPEPSGAGIAVPLGGKPIGPPPEQTGIPTGFLLIAGCVVFYFVFVKPNNPPLPAAPVSSRPVAKIEKPLAAPAKEPVFMPEMLGSTSNRPMDPSSLGALPEFSDSYRPGELPVFGTPRPSDPLGLFDMMKDALPAESNKPGKASR